MVALSKCTQEGPVAPFGALLTSRYGLLPLVSFVGFRGVVVAVGVGKPVQPANQLPESVLWSLGFVGLRCALSEGTREGSWGLPLDVCAASSSLLLSVLVFFLLFSFLFHNDRQVSFYC